MVWYLEHNVGTMLTRLLTATFIALHSARTVWHFVSKGTPISLGMFLGHVYWMRIRPTAWHLIEVVIADALAANSIPNPLEKLEQIVFFRVYSSKRIGCSDVAQRFPSRFQTTWLESA